MAKSQSPGEGWAWFGDPKGKGRWGIDTFSDHWDAQQKEWFSNADKWQQTRKKGPTLPGWFSGTYDPVSGKAFGSDWSGHQGWLSQGGDLTAEHYGQPGSWSMTYKMRPDGSASHTVGDVWWDRANRDQYKNFDSKAQWDAAPQFISKDPNYQTKLAEQKGRMREDLVKKVQKGDSTASELYYWDLQHGQKDLAGGKHFTEEFSEKDTAAKQERLKKETWGIVREEKKPTGGQTLAERLRSLNAVAMADPLPHPSKDTPQRPNPNAPPSSPYEPGKSPVPSRDDRFMVNNNEMKIASSLSAGSYGGYIDAGRKRGFISPEQGQRMLKNPDAFKATPGELKLIREGLNLPQASTKGTKTKAKGSAWDQYLQRNVLQIPDIAMDDPSSYFGGSGLSGHYDIGDGVSRSGHQIMNLKNKRPSNISPKTLKLLDAFKLPGV